VIESPLIQEIVARSRQEARHEKTQELIVRFLTRRFGPLPLRLTTELRTIADEPKLDDLLEWAAQCPDLDAFRARLSS
jgi:hypothetical protein